MFRRWCANATNDVVEIEGEPCEVGRKREVNEMANSARVKYFNELEVKTRETVYLVRVAAFVPQAIRNTYGTAASVIRIELWCPLLSRSALNLHRFCAD